MESHVRYSDKTVCVVDNSLFVELASTLAKSFGKVLYYAPWESAFPKSNQTLIGKGLPNVRRIDSIWPFLDDIDLFVFPDIFMGSLQVHLESIGKRVWGSRMGEDLEIKRVDAKIKMRKLGLNVGHFVVVEGFDDLRDYLKHHPNVYVKVSKTRGDLETLYAKNYAFVETVLDDLEHKLGAKKSIMEFIVEDAIDNAAELSYDGYTIDGKYPKNSMAGLEIKDRCLLMRARPYKELPNQVRETNAKIASLLGSYRYRNFFANELRITKDGTAYAIDPCCRMGSPPGGLLMYMIENLADVIWHGASGELVEPKLSGHWGAEMILYSEWADTQWLKLDIPKDIADNVKLKNRVLINNKTYVVPQNMGPSFGSVVATGDTMDQAIDRCKEVAEKVEGYCVHVMNDSIDKAKEEIEKLEKFGIDFFSEGQTERAEEDDEDAPASLASLLSGKKKRLADELSESLGKRNGRRPAAA